MQPNILGGRGRVQGGRGLWPAGVCDWAVANGPCFYSQPSTEGNESSHVVDGMHLFCNMIR